MARNTVLTSAARRFRAGWPARRHGSSRRRRRSAEKKVNNKENQVSIISNHSGKKILIQIYIHVLGINPRSFYPFYPSALMWSRVQNLGLAVWAVILGYFLHGSRREIAFYVSNTLYNLKLFSLRIIHDKGLHDMYCLT